MKNLKKDNKGVAFVTVLITITFISILAVSLLYMVYLNFLTKSLRTRANDNFYTGEFAVDEVAAAIQQAAASAVDAGGKLDEAKTAIANAVGATGSTYDPAVISANLVKVADSADNVNISVTTAPGKTPDYVVTENQIVIKNLAFTTENSSGFTSTIYTDMEINFPSTPPGTYDVNDFSVISSSMYNTKGSGGAVNFTGCIYVSGKNNGGDALVNDKGTLVSILSPQGIIDGDLVIKKSSSGAPSAISIAGDVKVLGDIDIASDCSLSVTGKLSYSGSMNCDGYKVGNIVHDNMKALKDKIQDNGTLAEAIYAKHVYCFQMGNDGGPSAELADMADMDSYGAKMGGASAIKDNYKYKDKDGKTWIFPIYYVSSWNGGHGAKYIKDTGFKDYDSQPKAYKAQIELDSGKYNGGGYDLIMTSADIKVEGDAKNCTLLTLDTVTAENDGQVQMTKMSDKGYEAAKGALVDMNGMQVPGSQTLDGYVTGDYYDFLACLMNEDYFCFKYDAESGVFSSSKSEKYTEDDIFSKNGDNKFVHEDGSICTHDKTCKKRVIAKDFQVDSSSRYFVFKISGYTRNSNVQIKTDAVTKKPYFWVDNSKKNFPGNKKPTMAIPYGYFLASNTSNIVSEYLGAAEDDVKPDISTVTYRNWYKE